MLYWWAEDPSREPWMRKSSPTRCGGCYFTNNRDFEKTADAVIFDNTRYLTILRGRKANATLYRNHLPEIGNFG